VVKLRINSRVRFIGPATLHMPRKQKINREKVQGRPQHSLPRVQLLNLTR
jgi:hypothetical protein